MSPDEMNRNINWIYLVIFLDFFGVSLMLPSMSMYLRGLGASYSMIGAMTSIYAFMQLVSGPIIGSLSDRIGRKSIFLVSCITIGLCYIAVGFTSSLYVILLLRAVIGVFKHSQVLIRAIIVDQVSSDNQPLVFGRLKSVIGISFALGPIIGGHLTEIKGGFTYIALCAGSLFIFNTVMVFVFFDERTSSDESKRRKPRERSRGLLESAITAVTDLTNINWLVFGDIFLLKFLGSFASVAYYSNYNIRIQERFDISPKISGYTIAFQSAVGVITGLFISSINDKFYKDDVDYKKRNVHNFLLMAVAYSCSYLSPSLPLFMVAGVFFQVPHMVLRVSLTNVVIQRSPASQQGSVAGFDQSVLSIARMIGPLTVGVIEDYLGSNSGTLLSALASFLAVFISVGLTTPHVKAA